MTDNNPLLTSSPLPRFSVVKPDLIEPAIDTILADNRKQINALLTTMDEPSWDNLVMKLDFLDERFQQMWSPIGHLKSVKSTQALHQAVEACLPKISEYATELTQNKILYQAYEKLSAEQYGVFNTAQKQVIKNTLRDFRLAGVSLPEEKQAQFKVLSQRLSILSNQFSQNVLEATDDWSYWVEEQAELAGVPEHAMALFKQKAKQQNKSGWLIGLDFPSYQAVVTYCEHQALREKLYTAFVTRASEFDKNKQNWDNSAIMVEILECRQQLAELLNFENYSSYSLATKTADSTDEVLTFLEDLATRVYPVATQEYQALCDFAQSQGAMLPLKPWDVTYYSERLRQAQYDFSEEDLRPYFPIDQVLSGLFSVIEKLYGIKLKEESNFDTWHPDVRFFSLMNEKGEIQAQCYIDLFARDQKRGGAWMDECRIRWRNQEGDLQHPIAYIVTNFSAPINNDPALLTHDEVITLFHEFGHGLHHMLTQVEYLSVSGINGVPWDVVEFPSQFMEHWAWQSEVMVLISKHYKTGEMLPQHLLQKALDAKHFQAGMKLARQLEFALFDMRLHTEAFSAYSTDNIQALLDEIRSKICVVPIAEFNRFQLSFSHIFSGGYAAGYYSYLWAEVLSSDAFSLFEEQGIFDQATGQQFLQKVLSQGGSEDMMSLFVAFRGRKPSLEAFLRHHGLNSNNENSD